MHNEIESGGQELKFRLNWDTYNCAKNVHIRSYSGPHFPALGLNTE